MVPKMKIVKALAYVAVILVVAVIASAQTSSVESRITQPIDESNRVVLHGNVYPVARAEFDRGLAPANLPLEHRWLVLKRSASQEAALETLMAQQQDKTSPNYHKWLTPAEFGLQYGPSAQDVQTVVRWLTSHGIGVSQVTNGRMELEFSGTAAEIQQAFHTEIHMYNVNGEQHYANATDPEIPSALASVVAGVAALHDFKPRPSGHRVPLTANGTPIRRANPNFTYPSGCTPTGTNATCNFTLGPADFNTIYNVPASATGSGQTIAVLGQATIQTSDITGFRTMFNVTPTTSLPTIVSPAGDNPPSLSASDASGDEGESDLDLEWSGAIAPSASIIFITSSNVEDSAVYVVDNNVAPIIGLSYGVCELGAGTSGNAGFNSIWQQAVAQGQTVVVSTGDTGAASCEAPTTAPWFATTGLAVSGLASTVYNLAVGGTDFDDLTNPTNYWNTSNSGSGEVSAKSYIPETTYDDSCTNPAWGQFGLSNIPLSNCNDTTDTNFVQFISPIGGGGGVSSCTSSDGTDTSSCTGGYAKATWQAAPGVPNDGKRDVPDVSMFAGDGFSGSFYIVCESDANTPSGAACSTADPTSTTSTFVGFGGTSASAQVMAGIMALVKQKNSPNTGMGLVNPTFYELASDQASMSCNSSSPASGCVFNDVTVGNNAVPCAVGSANCGVTASGENGGILSGCDSGAGYDLVTGLGSVNVGNLLNSWSTATGSSTADFQLSLQSCNATANITSPGTSGSVGITITAVNGFTGSYTITCSGLPSMSTCTSTQSASGAVTSATVTVATTAPVTGNVAPNGHPAWPLQLIKLAIPMMALAIFLFLMGRFRGWSRRWAIGLATAAAVILLVAGCGGGGNSGGGGCTTCTGGTPTGYVSAATITVTSGSTTHTMPFNVNVE